MEAANSAAARIAARPLFIALDGVTDPQQNLGAVIRLAAAFWCQWCDSAGTPFRFSERRRLEGVCRCGCAYAGGARGEPD